MNIHYLFFLNRTKLDKRIFFKIIRCYWVFKNKKFENFVIVMIMVSSISLVVSTYKNYFVFSIIDLFVTYFFIFECLMKIITLGFI